MVLKVATTWPISSRRGIRAVLVSGLEILDECRGPGKGDAFIRLPLGRAEDAFGNGAGLAVKIRVDGGDGHGHCPWAPAGCFYQVQHADKIAVGQGIHAEHLVSLRENANVGMFYMIDTVSPDMQILFLIPFSTLAASMRSRLSANP